MSNAPVWKHNVVLGESPDTALVPQEQLQAKQRECFPPRFNPELRENGTVREQLRKGGEWRTD